MVFSVLLAAGVAIDNLIDPLADGAVVAANHTFTTAYFQACFDPKVNHIASPYHIRLVLSALYPLAGAAVQEDLRVAFGLPEQEHDVIEQQKRLTEQLTAVAAGERRHLRALPFVLAEETLAQSELFEQRFLPLLPTAPPAFETVDLTDDIPSAAAVNSYYQRASIEIEDLVCEGDVFSLPPNCFRFMLFSGVSVLAPVGVRFDPTDTEVGPFRFVNEPDRQVPIMATKARLRYCHQQLLGDLRCSVVELLFAEPTTIVLQLLLPDEGSELKDLVAALNAEQLASIERNLRHRTVEVKLPSFMVREKTDTREPMKKLGYGGVFEIEDLKIFREPERVRLDGFYQHCYLAVGESAGEAPPVASDGAAVGPSTPEVKFHANRPFLFLVRRSEDGNVLLIGHFSRYIDPDEQW
ncbi:leukocyte elastase inhibitor-like [Anopheles darlingi]|uniref:leukocyte elastase inhibitor-like n=1 Tax=Anopheles darlingi TaxID=43151 RepID=UPI0021002B11|nr:leukocyte elastase inhibitor-like [Anopheles darlingi]